MALGILDRFLNYFRGLPSPAADAYVPAGELAPSDYQMRREMFPVYPFAGWTPGRIMQMLESHDVGSFTDSELFYHALRKEGLIASALSMRAAASGEFGWSLQCPQDAPNTIHLFTEALAGNWRKVMSDDTREEIVERTDVFGFQVCRLQWTTDRGQRMPIFQPWTHSSLSWRQDLWCYQGMSFGPDGGVELIRPDGREWAIFSLGGTRPWLKGLIRILAFIYFGIITGDDRWINFNDKFAEPLKKRITPRLSRENAEQQRLYQKEEAMRGGDMVLCPQDPATGRGYDLDYVQVNALGYKTLQDQLSRFDERAAIAILGHNLLQHVGGGSLAAMREAMKLLRKVAKRDTRFLSSGCEPVATVWARANFGDVVVDGQREPLFPELNGQPPEDKTWSLVYDTTDPDDRQVEATSAAQYAQGFATFTKGLQNAGILVQELEQAGKLDIDWAETAQRCGLALMGGDESYTQDDDEDAQLDGERYIDPPSHVKQAAQRALGWLRQSRRTGWEEQRQLAVRLVRGRCTGADLRACAAYFAKHDDDRKAPGFGQLKRPTSARLAWGLHGDAGDGRGARWVRQQAAVPVQLAGAGLAAKGKSGRTKDLVGIASVAVFDASGQRLLFGKRRDSGKWTMPGGHLEPGEAPADGAGRELWEEAGIKAPLAYLGSGTAGRGFMIHCFRCTAHMEPIAHNDPDEEISEFEWMSLPLPPEVLANLHAPRNVTLALLGLIPREGMQLAAKS
jgi:8-oxo-dGTP pyrophosphatase MutT (NUDIX family)